MTDKEKLIELLGEVTVEQVVCSSDGTPVSRHVCRVVDEGDAECLADHLIANGVTVQKWIPASEPPKEEGFYLCLNEAGNHFEAFYSLSEEAFGMECEIFDPEMFRFLDVGWNVYEVTHWMPMPKPPKEDA